MKKISIFKDGRAKITKNKNMSKSYPFQIPHMQFFHVTENTVEGGESIWTDSFSALREMSEERPDFLEVLKTVPVTYRYTPPGTGIFEMSHHCVVNMLGKDIWQTVDHPFNLDSAICVCKPELRMRKLNS